MSTSKPPDVQCTTYHAILMVADVAASIAYYVHALGFRLAFSEGQPPEFAGVNLGHVQLFLERGTPGPDGCGVYFVVDDADRLHAFHQANGVVVLEPPGDRPYHLRDYTILDNAGYRITFGHRLAAGRSDA
jgi:catechol 2,3-dioxygenase-like lactoylglutathione lyase family enzyme